VLSTVLRKSLVRPALLLVLLPQRKRHKIEFFWRAPEIDRDFVLLTTFQDSTSKALRIDF
jgi:hypothetical protein